jgi:hypothetical protein
MVSRVPSRSPPRGWDAWQGRESFRRIFCKSSSMKITRLHPRGIPKPQRNGIAAFQKHLPAEWFGYAKRSVLSSTHCVKRLRRTGRRSPRSIIVWQERRGSARSRCKVGASRSPSARIAICRTGSPQIWPTSSLHMSQLVYASVAGRAAPLSSMTVRGVQPAAGARWHFAAIAIRSRLIAHA